MLSLPMQVEKLSLRREESSPRPQHKPGIEFIFIILVLGRMLGQMHELEGQPGHTVSSNQSWPQCQTLSKSATKQDLEKGLVGKMLATQA